MPKMAKNSYHYLIMGISLIITMMIVLQTWLCVQFWRITQMAMLNKLINCFADQLSLGINGTEMIIEK